MRIAILAPPGVQSLDVVGPAEVFWEAARRLGRPEAYDVQVMATTPGPIRGTGSLRFLADSTIADPDEAIDTLLVGGDPSFQVVQPEVVAWLRRRAPTVRRYGSVCTGVFLLAAAGLLDGRLVTTHWECAARLRAEYPGLRLDTERIFIRDGALWTTAGVTAGMDMALAMVEEDHGRDLALAVSRYMVVFLKRPGGQSQFSAHLVAQLSETTAIQQAQQYALANIDRDLSVGAMADHAGMSARNFARVFRRETSMTPAQFVGTARIEAARRSLQDTALPLQRVADQCGFENVEQMRRTFVRHLGIGPGDYRKRFGATFQTSRPLAGNLPVTERAD